jgi:hypothetical protein
MKSRTDDRASIKKNIASTAMTAVMSLATVMGCAPTAFANPPLPLGPAAQGQPIPRVVVTGKRMTIQQKAEYDAELRTKRAEKQKDKKSSQS